MSSVSLAERIHFRWANIVVLVTVDDVDGGDGLREWELIYTALSHSSSYSIEVLVPVILSVCIAL